MDVYKRTEFVKNDPLVSILVPVYNVAEYIERCARSVFEQTYDNLDILFVDDGCTDDSIYILERVIVEYPHFKKRIRIIHHVTNRGLSATRNTLVHNSAGEFVFHLDSDDWIEPNTIEVLVKEQVHSDADIVMGRTILHNEEGNVYWISKDGFELERRTFIEEALLWHIWFYPWNRLIRKCLYTDHQIKCDENYRREDFSIFYRLYYFAKKISGVNTYTYHYIRRPGSTMRLSLNDRTKMEEYVRYDRVISDFFKDNDADLYEKSLIFHINKLNSIVKIEFENNNKPDFVYFVGKLKHETDRRYWHVIGWDNPLIRFISSHYLTRCFFCRRRKK